MKQVKKLKLSELSKKELNERQLKELKGGDYCDDKCGSISPSHGGSSSWWRGYF